MTPRLIATAVLSAVLLAGGASAAEPLASGPPVGSKNDRDGFFPQWVSGPCAGMRLCPV